MITKKKLYDLIDDLDKRLKEKDTQIEALNWCITNPKYARVDTSFNFGFNPTNSLKNSSNSISTLNNEIPSELTLTYFNKLECKVLEACIVRVISGYIREPEFLYDVNSGNIEIIFQIIAHDNIRKHIKYTCNVYDIVAKQNPNVFILNINNHEWIKLPCVSYSDNSTNNNPIIL